MKTKSVISRAARIRAAVTSATSGKGCVCPGARIEEILGEEIARYPDQIMSLDLLPALDVWKFIGYTADFEEIEVTQHMMMEGKSMNDATVPLVGWKPIRMGVLNGRIQAMQVDAERPSSDHYMEPGPYAGIPFCKGPSGHEHTPCADPFCYRRR